MGTGFSNATIRRISLRASHNGMMPNTPNEQSINCQTNGIPRNGPQINASGTMSAHAIIPNSTTQQPGSFPQRLSIHSLLLPAAIPSAVAP